MWCDSYILCLIFLYHVDENSAQVSYPYIVSINLKLQEATIPRVIAESLVGNNTILAPYFDYSQVSLDNVAEILGERNVTLKEAFKILDIQFDDVYNMVSRNDLMNTIETANINTHHLYTAFVQYFLTDPMQDVPKILNCLNIDNIKFATAAVFGTDEEMLKILLKGSYTKRNVEKTLEVVNQDLTLKDLFNFFKFSRLWEALMENARSSTHVVDAFKSLFVVNKVLNFLNFLNVSANDFNRNEAFGKVLTNFVDTKEELIGSVTSPTSIITNSNSKTLIDYEYLQNYTLLIATSVENQDIKHMILSISKPTSSVATLYIDGKLNLQQYVDIPSNTGSVNLKNCTYVSLNTFCDSLYTENVVANLVDNKFVTINKTNTTVFHVGSPLLCEQHLYGVADWECESSILFISTRLDISPYNINPESYLAVVMNYVKQARAMVLGGICNVLKYLNVNICSNISIS